MEHLFDGIGGYNSWAFMAIAFGGIILGILLVILFRYKGIVGILGGLPIFAYLSANTIQASNPAIAAILPILSLLWVVIWILIIVQVAGRSGLAEELNRKAE